MLSNKRLLTLASPIYRYYSEWLEQYTLLSTTSHLRYLGVRKQALPRLLNRLHVMAITNLHWIYTTKRHKERHLDPQFWRHTHPPR